MMEEYAIVEFEDGLQLIPTSWLTKNKSAAYWPQITSHARFTKAVKERMQYDDSWLLYNVKRILATANTYEKGFKKLKKAEFISDINSESDVPNEDLKKSRKDRAKKIRSSSDDTTDDDEGIQLPSFPMIPQIKTTYNKSNNKFNNKLNQQSNTTENITTIQHKNGNELEKSSTNTNFSEMKKKDERIICYDLTNNNEEIIDENENSLHDKFFDKVIKSSSNASNSEFQRYVIRKLTDITFKISSIDKQQKHFNEKLNTVHTTLQRVETFYSNEKIQDKETEENLMDNFPISNIENLEQFEKLLIEGTINRKELIKQLLRIGGNDIKGVTYNLLRKLLSDKVASEFSYVGGKKKRVFYDLELRKIIFNVVQIQFMEATECNIADPIKSWLRHAKERYLKKNNNEVRTCTSGRENRD